MPEKNPKEEKCPKCGQKMVGWCVPCTVRSATKK